jgi:hypothetical protein
MVLSSAAGTRSMETRRDGAALYLTIIIMAATAFQSPGQHLVRGHSDAPPGDSSQR